MCEDAAASYARFRQATAHLTRKQKEDLADKLETIEASGDPRSPTGLLAALLAAAPMPSKACQSLG
jgi:hypothetical protein